LKSARANRPLHDIKKCCHRLTNSLCFHASVENLVSVVSLKVIDGMLGLPPLLAYQITVCSQPVTGR